MNTDADQALRAALASELRTAGLIADPLRYRATCAAAFDRGDMQRARFGQRIDAALVCSLSEALHRPHLEGDVTRILGFGDALTRFAAAPVRLDAAVEERVVELGALANLIVTMYDGCLDDASAAGDPLPRDALARAWSLEEATADGSASAAQALLTRLVFEYRSRLIALGTGPARELVERAIARMYAAERATREGHNPAALLRKNALPFVVMGFPAWVAGSRTADDGCIRWHLAWLYRLGSFIGWVDDIIDLSADRAAGHPNRVLDAFLADQVAGLPAAVAARGRRVMKEWCVRVDRSRHSMAGILPTVVTSWFGGAEAAA